EANREKWVNHFTPRTIIFLMKTIKDLYQSRDVRTLPQKPACATTEVTDSRGKAAPGAGDAHRGLALPFGGSLGGTPLTSYSKAKGRRTGRYRAPFSFLKVPHHPEGEDQQWGQRNCGLARAGNSRGHRDIRRPEPAAKEAAEALVRHILNWGPEEKAPPKRGLKCTGITPL